MGFSAQILHFCQKFQQFPDSQKLKVGNCSPSLALDTTPLVAETLIKEILSSDLMKQLRNR